MLECSTKIVSKPPANVITITVQAPDDDNDQNGDEDGQSLKSSHV